MRFFYPEPWGYMIIISNKNYFTKSTCIKFSIEPVTVRAQSSKKRVSYISSTYKIEHFPSFYKTQMFYNSTPTEANLCSLVQKAYHIEFHDLRSALPQGCNKWWKTCFKCYTLMRVGGRGVPTSELQLPSIWTLRQMLAKELALRCNETLWENPYLSTL